MRTRNLLLGFGFFVYAGLILISFFHNSTLIETIVDLSITTISVIVGYVISIYSKNKNKET